jgi:hypothetical protein
MPSTRQIHEPAGTGVFAVHTGTHLPVAQVRSQIHRRWSRSAHGFCGDDAERHGLLDMDAARNAAWRTARWLKRIAG